MFGSRISLIVGFVPVAIVFVIGGTVGMLAGYLGGWVDNSLMRFTDIIYAFPDLLFVIIIVATLRGTAFGDILGGLLLIFVGIAVVGWVGLARLVRGQVLSLKHREFVEAARCIGATPARIMGISAPLHKKAAGGRHRISVRLVCKFRRAALSARLILIG